MSIPIEVYYNGACPVCSREIGQYRRSAERHGVEARWVDVAADPDALGADGIDRHGSLRRLHVRTADGLAAGVPAFVALWRRLPGWSGFACTADNPVLRPVAGFVYDRILAPALFRWHLWRHPEAAAPSCACRGSSGSSRPNVEATR